MQHAVQNPGIALRYIPGSLVGYRRRNRPAVRCLPFPFQPANLSTHPAIYALGPSTLQKNCRNVTMPLEFVRGRGILVIVQLIVTTGSREGQVISVSSEKFIIGRAGDCHVRSKSELISRYHCAILVGDEVVVRDLGSRNGVRLNDERICAEQRLNNGDKLGIGPLEFYVRISADSTEPIDEANVSQYLTSGDNDDSGATQSTLTVLQDHWQSLNQGTK